MLVQNPADAAAAALRLEELGYHGGYTFEGPHDPFLPLAVAAGATSRLELATAIAIAFARNPMLLANLGYDLQLLSEGRFILGLGSQIRPHIQKRFSMPWSRPAARMRDLVLAIRAIWRAWQEGEKLDYRGEFYSHTLMTPVFNPGPNPHGLPPIFVAGVGPDLQAGPTQDGRHRDPHDPLEVRRDVGKVMLGVGRPEPVGGCLGEIAEAFLAHLQRFFGGALVLLEA
ncbi:MAG: LLM class flavin-dependent oxidoreductase, partial [Myxococcota bacterium]|nr:LLM class flavin-dependent oxidoreductase [Myxococcota bacterium]